MWLPESFLENDPIQAHHRAMKPIITIWLLFAASLVYANEPSAPSDAMKPRILLVALKENIAIRMGDTVQLKDSDFSARLSGFSRPTCAVPGENCGVVFSNLPSPEFQYREGGIDCDMSATNRRDRKCMGKLKHMVTADSVTDRANVTVRVLERRKK